VPAAVPTLLPALGDAHVLRHVALRPRLEESLRALAARVFASAKKTHPTTESTRHRRQRTETENGRVVRWWVWIAVVRYIFSAVGRVGRGRNEEEKRSTKNIKQNPKKYLEAVVQVLKMSFSHVYFKRLLLLPF